MIFEAFSSGRAVKPPPPAEPLGIAFYSAAAARARRSSDPDYPRYPMREASIED
jgi:hypothetical protein